MTANPSKPLDRLADALPQEFPFYGIGAFSLERNHEQSSINDPDAVTENAVFLAYAFQGDYSGVLLLALNRALDISMYSEAGNIIISRMAGALSPEIDLLVSPPRIIPSEQAVKLINSSGHFLRSNYLHVSADKSAKPAIVDVFLISTQTKSRQEDL